MPQERCQHREEEEDGQTDAGRTEGDVEGERESGRPPAARRPRSQMLGSLFGKTEARAHIPVERSFFIFLFLFSMVKKVGALFLPTPSLPGNNISA